MTREELTDIKVLANSVEEAKKLYNYFTDLGFRANIGDFIDSVGHLTFRTYEEVPISFNQLHTDYFKLAGDSNTRTLTMEDIFGESLEAKKLRLQKELQEVEESIKEEKEIKEGDYVICNVDYDPGNQFTKGKIYKSTKFSQYKAIWVERDDRGSKNGLGFQNFRKAAKKEVDDYLASLPREQEYTLSNGQSVIITKDIAKWNNYSYNICDLKNIICDTPDRGKMIGIYGGIEVKVYSEVQVWFGCTSGTSAFVRELREIVSIAESLK